MKEEKIICPVCGNIDNFHFNYDYSKPDLPVDEILCNECGEFFKLDNSENEPAEESNSFIKIDKFKNLKIGQEFECYGDTAINYDYPKICKCIKDSEDLAHEIDGISFYISGDESVFI